MSVVLKSLVATSRKKAISLSRPFVDRDAALRFVEQVVLPGYTGAKVTRHENEIVVDLDTHVHRFKVVSDPGQAGLLDYGRRYNS